MKALRRRAGITEVVPTFFAGPLSQEADDDSVKFDYFVGHVPPNQVRDSTLDEVSDQAWLASDADQSGSTEFDYWQEPPVGAVQRVETAEEFWSGWLSAEADPSEVNPWDGLWVDAQLPWVQRDPTLDETSDQAWLSVEADNTRVERRQNLFLDFQLAAPEPPPITEVYGVEWSPDAVTPTFDATQIPWPLARDESLVGPIPRIASEGFDGWLSADADLSAVGVWDALFVDAQRPWAQRDPVLDETADQNWLAAEADRSGVSPFDYFVDAQRPNPPIGTADGADASWSPDAFAPPFDPTTLPQPTSVEPPFVPPTVGPAYEAWSGWLAAEAGRGDAIFDYWQEPPRALPPPPDVPLDETSDQAWLAGEAGGSDAVLDYFVDTPRSVPPFVVPSDGGDVSWSPDISPAFEFFSDGPLPAAPFVVQLDTGDVSWSPETFGFDPTQQPNLFVDLPGIARWVVPTPESADLSWFQGVPSRVIDFEIDPALLKWRLDQPEPKWELGPALVKWSGGAPEPKWDADRASRKWNE